MKNMVLHIINGNPDFMEERYVEEYTFKSIVESFRDGTYDIRDINEITGFGHFDPDSDDDDLCMK